MNAAHVHLVLNHVPIFGLIFGSLFIAAGLVRRNSDVARAGVAVLVLTALVAIPVYFTGEGAEEIIEHLPGMSEDIIERHEEAGRVALWALEILGAVALVGLVVYRRPKLMPVWFLPLVLGLATLVGLWVAWTSHLGGQVRHEETRADFDASIVAEDEDE